VGGGMPRPAKLILTADGKSTWSELPAKGNLTKQTLTDDVEILYENESQLVIRLKQALRDGDLIVILDKKAIAAIIPEPLHVSFFSLRFHASMALECYFFRSVT
jgi:hypothetical protein